MKKIPQVWHSPFRWMGFWSVGFVSVCVLMFDGGIAGRMAILAVLLSVPTALILEFRRSDQPTKTDLWFVKLSVPLLFGLGFLFKALHEFFFQP